MDDYTLVIILTFFGFIGLAALLLVPVYRFLNREERLSESWTRDLHESSGGEGAVLGEGTAGSTDKIDG